MSLNILAAGAQAGPQLVSWNARDVMLYALGVGAGQADPFDELDLTTENSEGKTLRTLPTFALVVAQSSRLQPDIGNIDRTRVVHALQSLDLPKPLPVQGEAVISSRVEAIEDKGSGALVTTLTEATEPTSGKYLFSCTAAIFIRGAGGFNPARKPTGQRPQAPERACDVTVACTTRPDQTLLYRLCADRNPLHSDPAFAARSGLERPILHGLCTYGSVARVLLREVGADLRHISARFTKPVLPGDTLTAQAWQLPEGWYFRVLNSADEVVLDDGRLTLATLDSHCS